MQLTSNIFPSESHFQSTPIFIPQKTILHDTSLSNSTPRLVDSIYCIHIHSDRTRLFTCKGGNVVYHLKRTGNQKQIYFLLIKSIRHLTIISCLQVCIHTYINTCTFSVPVRHQGGRRRLLHFLKSRYEFKEYHPTEKYQNHSLILSNI